jgi:hypothetical protein
VTLEQIEETLPNGLHDAQLRQMRWDFERATLVLDLDVLTLCPQSVAGEATSTAGRRSDLLVCALSLAQFRKQMRPS